MENPAVAVAPAKVYTCSVYPCGSTSIQEDAPAFYSFPKDLQRCSLWVRRCSKSEVSELFRRYGTRRLHSRNRVCSEHFQDQDFLDPEDKSHGLKIDAIPSKNFQTRSASSSFSDSKSGSESSSSDDDDDDDESADNQSGEESRTVAQDDSSDSSVDPSSKKEDGTLTEEAVILKKRLLDNQRKNSRLKRAIERLKRQNVRYRNKLS